MGLDILETPQIAMNHIQVIENTEAQPQAELATVIRPVAVLCRTHLSAEIRMFLEIPIRTQDITTTGRERR